MPHSVATSSPSHLSEHMSPSRSPPPPPRRCREQTPEGSPHAEVWLKPKLSPRGCVTKEEELKSLLAAMNLGLNAPTTGLVNSVPAEHLNGQRVLLQLRRVLLSQLWTLWARTCQGWARPDSELHHNSHSGSRSMITAILEPDFSGSMLVAWCKQCPRDTRANCRHTHS